MKASPLAAIFSIAPSAFSGEDRSEDRRADVDAIAGWLDRNFFKLKR